MRYSLMSGAGNLFAVVDGFVDALPRDPATTARGVCAPASDGGLEPRPDGLILVRPSGGGADCAMEVYNADGSRPETCGNGLRCVAKLVADRGHVARAAFVIATDAGPCPTTVEREGGAVTRARVHMGVPRVLAPEALLALGATTVRATLVDMGNPHCVLFVEDERRAPVETWGRLLERHPRFPDGTNVEFLALREAGAFLRVWERGVGETRACGSGACAAAAAAVGKGLARWPMRLQLPGGALVVDSDARGGVSLEGPVLEISSGEWEPARRSR